MKSKKKSVAVAVRAKAGTSLPRSDASDREVAAYWDTHSAADVWEDSEPVVAGTRLPEFQAEPKKAKA